MPGTTPAVRLPAAPALARVRGWWSRAAAAFESPWVAYPLLLILQLKMIWGVWAMRDVTTGDTVSYFTVAWRWYADGQVNVAWSPLYTAFFGSFLFVNPDPVWATFAHRVVIVLAAAGLALAVFRRLLPPAVAWLCAAWWAVLPIVFNTLYEVHLFAALPVLLAWLLLASSRGPWRRAAGLAVLAASAVLVRNELSVAAGVLGLVLAGFEWRAVRRGGGPGAGRTLLAYAVALGAAAGLCAATYAASYIKYPKLAVMMEEKHTLNMAQVYAYGHQQRHPEWTKSPWIECYGLMEETFGARLPSLREMIAANPRAVATHFLWNLSLTPSGVQVLLFYQASGSVSPDYDPVVKGRLNQRRAVALSAAVLAVWGVGLWALWRTRRAWVPGCPSGRALAWAAMLAVASVVPLVILTQRPRPSYLFAFGASLIALTGLCFHAATARWRVADRLRAVMPLVMVGLVVLVPRHFTRATATPQPVAKAVQRLLPHRDAVEAAGGLVLVPARESVGWYVLPGRKWEKSHPLVPFAELLADARPGEAFAALLDRHGVVYAYLDEWTLGMLAAGKCGAAAAFVDGRDAPGWRRIDGGDRPGDRWRLYRRAD